MDETAHHRFPAAPLAAACDRLPAGAGVRGHVPARHHQRAARRGRQAHLKQMDVRL